jgi:hypothetical protein
VVAFFNNDGIAVHVGECQKGRSGVSAVSITRGKIDLFPGQKKNIRRNDYPLINFKPKHPAGESHELGNPEGAFMIAPKVIYDLARAFLFLSIGY